MSAVGPILPYKNGQSRSACPWISDVNLFSYRKRWVRLCRVYEHASAPEDFGKAPPISASSWSATNSTAKWRGLDLGLTSALAEDEVILAGALTLREAG